MWLEKLLLFKYPNNIKMSFQNSACDVHLSAQPGATSLVAICNNDEGTGLETRLLLDDYLGNEDGKLYPYSVLLRLVVLEFLDS